MAWGKNGTSVTLTGTADDMDIVDLGAKKFNNILIHKIASGAGTMLMTFNNSTGQHYSDRFAYNNTQGSLTNAVSIDLAYSGSTDDFTFGHICFISGAEKLGIFWLCDPVSSGAVAPSRLELVVKYSPTSLTDTLDRIDLHNGTTGDYASDSNLSMLGADITPAGAVAIKVQDGAIFYETDTNKSYVLSSSVWTEL